MLLDVLEELLEEILLEVEELEEVELEVVTLLDVDDDALVELITLVVEVDVDSTFDVVVSSLDETTGSEERLEVALPTGPEQAEINKANKSDKCFFILLVLNS